MAVWLTAISLVGAASARAQSDPVTEQKPPAEPPPPIGMLGQHGLFRSYSSDLRGQAMTLTIGGVFGFSRNEGSFVGRDNNNRLTADIGVLFIPLENLEVSLGYHALVNSNSKSDGTLQLLGDVNIDIRGALSIPIGGARLGLSLGPHVRFLSGAKTLFQGRAISGGGVLGATLNLAPRLPLVFHLNFGFYIDNSRFLIDDFRKPGEENLGLGEMYQGFDGAVIASYGISAFAPMFQFRVGVEAPFERARIFAEYSLDYALDSGIPETFSVDGLRFGDNPQHIVLGATAFLTRDRSLSIGGALDFSFNGHSYPNQYGIPRQVPLTFLVGLAYTFGRATPTTVVRYKDPPLLPVVTKGTLVVKVVDDKTKRPIGDAEVTIDPTALRFLTGTKDGTVRAKDLDAGMFTVRATHAFYLPSAKKRVQVTAGETTEVEFELSRQVRAFGILEGQVTDLDGNPIQATVSIDKGRITVTGDAQGRFAKQLEPGKIQVEISAAGFISDIRMVEIRNGAKSIHDVSLHKSSP